MPSCCRSEACNKRFSGIFMNFDFPFCLMISDKGGAGTSKLISPLRRIQWIFKSNSSWNCLQNDTLVSWVHWLSASWQEVSRQLSKRTYLVTSLFGSFKLMWTLPVSGPSFVWVAAKKVVISSLIAHKQKGLRAFSVGRNRSWCLNFVVKNPANNHIFVLNRDRNKNTPPLFLQIF